MCLCTVEELDKRESKIDFRIRISRILFWKENSIPFDSENNCRIFRRTYLIEKQAILGLFTFNSKTQFHLNYIRFMKQLQKKTPKVETLSLFEQVEISKRLINAPEVRLPELRFNITEQLSLALQNRDKEALEFLISDNMKSDFLKDKMSFIQNFLKYCKTLERKHGKILVQTFNGACNASYCSLGRKGITVSVNTLKNNKQIWKFNLIIDEMPDGKIDLGKCFNFKVKREDF